MEDKEKEYIVDTIDVSISTVLDKNYSLNNDYSSLQSRTLLQWENDSDTNQCTKCKTLFGFFVRKHHCRKCGYIFCHYCCNLKRNIPNYVTIPTDTWGQTNRIYQLICNECNDRLDQMEKFESEIDLPQTKNSEYDIEYIMSMKDNSKLHGCYVNYYLSSFREIQYYLPSHKFNPKDRNILWANRKFFIGHDHWMTQLINSIDYSSGDGKKIGEICKLLDTYLKFLNSRKTKDVIKFKGKEEEEEDDNNSDTQSIKKFTPCSKLLCSSSCQEEFSLECILTLMNRKILSEEIQRYTIIFMERLKITDSILDNILIYILMNSLLSPFSEICKWLIHRCRNNINLCFKIYVQLKMCQKDEGNIKNKAIMLLLLLEQSICEEFLNRILSCYKFCQIIDRNFENIEALKVNISRILDLVLPTDLNETGWILDLENVTYLDSKTKPLRLTFHRNINTKEKIKSGKETKILLYKKEDIRHESIIMSVIEQMKHIVSTKYMDMNILTYKIQPIFQTGGFIEFILDSETLNEIIHGKVCSINPKINNTTRNLTNHILQNNKDSKIKDVLDRFTKSSAAWSVITFILGISDRHQSNIMLRKDGTLFHIDFGWILGRDPKLINCPEMMISREMEEVLQDTSSNSDFSKMSVKIYRLLVSNINIFSLMLYVLDYSCPKIKPHYSSEYITFEIKKRFLPGETYEHSKISTYNRIDNSTASYKYTIINFLHNTAKRIDKITDKPIKATKDLTEYISNYFIG